MKEYQDISSIIQPRDAWDALSMTEKAEMMKVAVRNGITNLQEIRKKYNEFAEGGNIYDGESEESNYMEVQKTPHVDLAYTNPWLYNKLHPSEKKVEAYEPTTFAGRMAQVAGAGELGQKYVDYSSSIVQQIPGIGLVPSALDLGYDVNRVYHSPSTTTVKDVALDAASLLPALRKTLKGWWMKGNSGSFITETGQVIINPRVASSLEVMLQPYRTAVNTGIYAGKAADFLDDSKAYLKEMYNDSYIGKHFPIKAYGGELGNYYGGWGDAWNFLKTGVQKARQKVKDWGLDKSPGEHVYRALESTANSDEQYRRNLYNTIDPTSDVPSGLDIIGYGLSALASKFGGEAPYTRVKNDSVADAAWAKRLGQPYNKSAIIDNGDGTFRLPASNEAEMPVDTNFLKNRIKDNQKLLNQVHGKRRSIVGLAIDADTKALDSLRKTYATGEPVEMDEHSYVNRNWDASSTKDLETSPLNVLHRYTMQYDKDSNKMKYWDLYDFNEFEQFVPGKPFKIQGSIDLNKRK